MELAAQRQPRQHGTVPHPLPPMFQLNAAQIYLEIISGGTALGISLPTAKQASRSYQNS